MRDNAVRCRTINESDLADIVALLRKGFPDRTAGYWMRGFDRHAARRKPSGYPTYGYMLENNGKPVGVLLTLFTEVERGGERSIRCNLSSWYVEPSFRCHGGILERLATLRPEVTYLNVTPAPHTSMFQDARGFKRYCEGQILALPAFSLRRIGARVSEINRSEALDELEPFERDLLRDHLDYGCIAVMAGDPKAQVPFVFQRRTIGLFPNNPNFGRLPCVQLVYCRCLEELPRFGGPIGRFLLRRHRIPWVVLDGQRGIPGLVSRYFAGRAPKYAKGPSAALLGDLSYTELVIFGP